MARESLVTTPPELVLRPLGHASLKRRTVMILILLWLLGVPLGLIIILFLLGIGR